MAARTPATPPDAAVGHVDDLAAAEARASLGPARPGRAASGPAGRDG